MYRITPREAAISKFKQDYYDFESIWNQMSDLQDSDITVEQISTTEFHLSAPGKTKPFESNIRVDIALDCFILGNPSPEQRVDGRLVIHGRRTRVR